MNFRRNEQQVFGARGGGTALQGGSRVLLWYHTLLLGAALTAIYLNLPVYLYVLNPSFLPKYIFFGIFILALPLMLLQRADLGEYMSSPFVLWALSFLLINFIHLQSFSLAGDVGVSNFSDNYGEARRSMVSTRSQYILFAVILGFIAYTCAEKYYLRAFWLIMLVLPAAVLFDFAQPGVLYPVDTDGAVLGRAAAMFINPTMAGEAILHAFLFACAVTPTRYRVPLFILAGAAILVTFSRSSIIAWVLIFMILVCMNTLPKSAMFWTALIFAVSLLFVGHFQSYLDSRQDFEDASSNLLSRLNFFSSFKFDDDSSEERAAVIKAGWDMFLQNPVFGAGAGSTHFWLHRGSTHNQLLSLAAEYGLFGVGLWMWLIVILWKGNFFKDRGLQVAMVFLFAFMSLFTHLMFDGAFNWLATFALISRRYK